MINLHDNQSKGTHKVSLFIERHTAGHFDSSGIEYITTTSIQQNQDKSITHNIFRIQDDDSMMMMLLLY